MDKILFCGLSLGLSAILCLSLTSAGIAGASRRTLPALPFLPSFYLFLIYFCTCAGSVFVCTCMHTECRSQRGMPGAVPSPPSSHFFETSSSLTLDLTKRLDWMPSSLQGFGCLPCPSLPLAFYPQLCYRCLPSIPRFYVGVGNPNPIPHGSSNVLYL